MSKKKSLIAYGNKHGYKLGFRFAQFHAWGREVYIPLLLKNPLATCDILYRITIEELPQKKFKNRRG